MDLKSLKAIFEGLIIATEGRKEEDLLNEARCIEIDLSDVNTSQALYSDEARQIICQFLTDNKAECEI